MSAPVRFNITVALGNAAMGDRYDVADALDALAARLRASDDRTGMLRDVNGNKVGWWEFVNDEK